MQFVNGLYYLHYTSQKSNLIFSKNPNDFYCKYHSFHYSETAFK